ncbi:MAG: spore germination protein GerW family protein [Acidimicrobiia bacterium]
MGELEPIAPKPGPPQPGPPAFVDRIRDAITVKRVWGKPIERDGITVIPAATVSGGGGGGGGQQPDGNVGSGGGFGVRARPAGAMVIRDGDAHWEPAVDPERRLAIAAVVSVVGILAARSLLRHHGRRHRRHR